MSTQGLGAFDTVAGQDYLGFYEGDSLKYNAVIGGLRFTRDDVAKATRIPSDSVRYDRKIPKVLRDRIEEWAVLLNIVAEHFNGDSRRTFTWFTTSNPLLGDLTPRDMIRFGRFQKLRKFILNAIAENKR